MFSIPVNHVNHVNQNNLIQLTPSIFSNMVFGNASDADILQALQYIKTLEPMQQLGYLIAPPDQVTKSDLLKILPLDDCSSEEPIEHYLKMVEELPIDLKSYFYNTNSFTPNSFSAEDYLLSTLVEKKWINSAGVYIKLLKKCDLTMAQICSPMLAYFSRDSFDTDVPVFFDTLRKHNFSKEEVLSIFCKSGSDTAFMVLARNSPPDISKLIDYMKEFEANPQQILTALEAVDEEGKSVLMHAISDFNDHYDSASILLILDAMGNQTNGSMHVISAYDSMFQKKEYLALLGLATHADNHEILNRVIDSLKSEKDNAQYLNILLNRDGYGTSIWEEAANLTRIQVIKRLLSDFAENSSEKKKVLLSEIKITGLLGDRKKPSILSQLWQKADTKEKKDACETFINDLFCEGIVDAKILRNLNIDYNLGSYIDSRADALIYLGSVLDQRNVERACFSRIGEYLNLPGILFHCADMGKIQRMNDLIREEKHLLDDYRYQGSSLWERFRQSPAVNETLRLADIANSLLNKPQGQKRERSGSDTKNPPDSHYKKNKPGEIAASSHKV